VIIPKKKKRKKEKNQVPLIPRLHISVYMILDKREITLPDF
jgi:hypothetical protein